MEGEEGKGGGGKKEKGVEDAGENSCTFNYDQEVFHQRMEALQFCCTRKSGPDAVYCVERLLYTIIVHIQLPLQHLICIIGSLMKLALWNKKIQKKKKSEMEKVVWRGGWLGGWRK